MRSRRASKARPRRTSRSTTSAGRFRPRSTPCSNPCPHCAGHPARSTGSTPRLRLDGDAPTAYRYGPNRIDVGGTAVDVGFSVDLTIEPSLQAFAQRTAACYTGRQDVCSALGMARAEDAGQALGHRMLERAVVRMAAVAVVDVASGRIEALAGALSPCARHEYDGPGRAGGCDKRLPYTPRYRPDALLNPAVFHDAMPGSVIKPIMAEAFLTDPDVGPRWLAAERAAMRNPGPPAADSLRGQLARSNSARFLDRMFCADQDFLHCERPWRVQAMAAAFGWNGGCATPRDDCGKQDLLFGRAVDAGRRVRARGTARHTDSVRPAAGRARRRQARRAFLPATGDGARQQQGACLRRGRGPAAADPRRLGEMQRRQCRGRGGRRLGTGTCPRFRARRGGHDGGPCRGGEWTDRIAPAASGERLARRGAARATVGSSPP